MKIKKQITRATAILIIVLLTNCTANIEEDCECERTTFTKVDRSTEYIHNIETTILQVEDVECREQVFARHVNNNIYETITCNN